MTSTFSAELESLTADLDAARAGLVTVCQSLSDADLARARRGGWPVARVLEHVIQSEQLYARLVSALRDQPVVEGATESGAPDSVDGALSRLGSGRRALLAALDGVDEDSFYRLRQFGHEEYSVLSVLENTASHDREHAAQISAIIESPASEKPPA